MSEKNFYLSRRNFLGFTAAAVLPLSACQTAMKTPGKVVGASAAAISNVQAIRSANGLAGLSADPTLERAALQQAAYMASAGRMAHTTSWGRGFASRVRDNEIHGLAAENIAMGRMDMDQLFARWMASPPHRRNMLDPQFTRFGLAYAESTNGSVERYWALVLAS
ncbi:uncharacterized protein YkwD [Phyllobacterium trifolii]|jgi:uncharacterized protein YkwD|uniref:Uncharacterized protein YkwD n=1 Tax=Phyllobacterium trifolii TaxID=300193 RepID=A0A839UD90_9HYPH|nr:CAP domain-containing protein [Phyllobacterium trifolii]MBB3149028.1 uncharacterized protein YkwD [Phyllobacterium trifolii]